MSRVELKHDRRTVIAIDKPELKKLKPDDESNRRHRLEIALYSLELQARKVPR
jgi:hypothetical protein